MWGHLLMVLSLTRVGIGEHRASSAFSDALTTPLKHSGLPFVTEIGVGKVIKGWDEGIILTFSGAFHP
jgi:hypothetical protein